MKLEKLKVKIRCDNGLCNNMASYTIVKKGTPREYQMNLCDDCITQLGEAISKLQEKPNNKMEG